MTHTLCMNCCNRLIMAPTQGLEPRTMESKSIVLPLHHIGIRNERSFRTTARKFAYKVPLYGEGAQDAYRFNGLCRAHSPFATLYREAIWGS